MRVTGSATPLSLNIRVVPAGTVRVTLLTFIVVAPIDADDVNVIVILGKCGIAVKDASDKDRTNSRPSLTARVDRPDATI